jgi:lipase
MVFADGHPSAKRRNHFASPEEMIERLLPKSSFGLFEPRIFEDYCRYGLVPAPGGGFDLACPPAMEASVYMTARTNRAIYESVRSLDIPVTVMRARVRTTESLVPDFSSSPTWPGLADEFKRGRDLHLVDCSHFIPMQVPDKVVAVIEEEVAAWLPA